MVDEGTPNNLPPRQRQSPRDWELTFLEWIRSGKTKHKFLRSIGLNPQSGHVHKKTRDWDKKLELYASGVRDTHVAAMIERDANGDISKEKTEEIRETVPVAPPVEVPSEALPFTGREAADVRPQAQPSLWQAVQEWRRKQAKDDYQTADLARTALKLILKDTLKREVVDGKEVYRTTLKPHELRQITQAMSDVQRVQRLALGLSTDNLGIDQPALPRDEAHVEKNVTPKEADVPTFVVEMSTRGKFMRPRPRRVN